jgi:hypothetical protein
VKQHIHAAIPQRCPGCQKPAGLHLVAFLTRGEVAVDLVAEQLAREASEPAGELEVGGEYTNRGPNPSTVRVTGWDPEREAYEVEPVTGAKLPSRFIVPAVAWLWTPAA